ncbi:MAG: exo-alpha-sialidase [Clostridia bacterium]|nr:exo-alpha-sialidase [Clostridia bacterium]
MGYGHKRKILLIIAVLTLIAAVMTCCRPANSSVGTDSAHIGASSDETGTAVNTEDLNKFDIILGEPHVVAHGPSFDEVGWYWGPYQFPSLTLLEGGKILCSFSNRPDSSTAYEFDSDIPNEYVSDDGGETWSIATGNELPADWQTHTGFYAKNRFQADYLDKYTPAYVTDDGNHKLYYAKDIPEFEQTCQCYSYDKNGKMINWLGEFIWDMMPVVVDDGLVMPLSSWAGLGSKPVTTSDGVMHFAMYSNGFNCDTGKVENGWHYNLYIFRSEDGGHFWEYESQILTTREYTKNQTIEGFCEPSMSVMPDGSVVMLIRTDAGTPSYLSRSTDNCRTWSDPVVFDKVGVLPQILTLDCGVTVASYGRPGIFVRATDDPRGLVWSDRVSLGIKGNLSNPDAWTWFSCSYTSLVPLDDHTALLAYADFQYPDEDGVKYKTILVRTVTIKYKSETGQ